MKTLEDKVAAYEEKMKQLEKEQTNEQVEPCSEINSTHFLLAYSILKSTYSAQIVLTQVLILNPWLLQLDMQKRRDCPALNWGLRKRIAWGTSILSNVYILWKACHLFSVIRLLLTILLPWHYNCARSLISM